MSEHKFRVWDKRRSEMLYSEVRDNPDEQLIHWDFKNGWCATRAKDSFVLNSNCAILMQYFGRKDKHRRDIYEGDLLQEQVNECKWLFEVKTVKGYGNNLFAVTRYCNFKIDDNGSQIMGDFYVNEGRDFISLSSIVIGNIYENPELLKDNTNER